jgi:hypothetical protein
MPVKYSSLPPDRTTQEQLSVDEDHLGGFLSEAGTDVSATNCRFCRAELGLDDETNASDRLEALFVLSITLGLRPGELRKLAWDPVDLSNGIIHVWRSASRTGDVKTPKSPRSGK